MSNSVSDSDTNTNNNTVNDTNTNNNTVNETTILESIAIVQRSAMELVIALTAGDNHHEDKSGQSPASKAAIEALPRRVVEEGEETRVKECVICLEEVNVGEEIKEMPCKHGFHLGCIDKWLGIHGSCPVCRFLMPKDEEETAEEEEEEGDGDGDGGDADGRRQRRRILLEVNFVFYVPSGSDLGSGRRSAN